jgi:SAM-dependent methyltransferase
VGDDNHDGFLSSGNHRYLECAFDSSGGIVNMMRFIVNQARKPTGLFGRLFARGMNVGHWPTIQWGLEHVDIGRADVILDVGCGGGKTIRHMAGLAQEGKVYGIDYSEASVAAAIGFNRKLIAAGRVDIRHGSVEALPFPGATFDLVTASETCYFWPDLVENLKGIRRVLKPGGRLLLINEAYQGASGENRNAQWAELGGFTLYSPDEYGAFLTQAGYATVQIDTLPAKAWLSVVGVKAR